MSDGFQSEWDEGSGGARTQGLMRACLQATLPSPWLLLLPPLSSRPLAPPRGPDTPSPHPAGAQPKARPPHCPTPSAVPAAGEKAEDDTISSEVPAAASLIVHHSGDVCIFNKNTWQFEGIFNVSPSFSLVWVQCSDKCKDI